MTEHIQVTVNGTVFNVEINSIEELDRPSFEVRVDGQRYSVQMSRANHSGAAVVAPPAAKVEPEPAAATTPTPPPAGDGQGQKITAPMPGKILMVAVKVGDKVQAKDTLCTLEAMKMEMTVAAPVAGTVQQVHAQVGESVGYGDLLFVIG